MNWKNLNVWKKAHGLVRKIYKVTSSFPREERYGLTAQIRRSSISIPAHIVEGQSRKTTKEYIQFLYGARGSLEETRYYLLLTKDLEYLDEDEYTYMEKQYEEVSKMLNSLIRRLKNE